MATKTRLHAAVLALLMIGASACEDTPVNPTPTPTTADLFFTSQLMAGGTTSRTFTTTRSGDVKVFFSSLIPDTSAVIGVGLGTFDGTTCTLTTSVMVNSGGTDAVITSNVPAGSYCVRIWDPGVLTKTNDFSVTLNIPIGS